MALKIFGKIIDEDSKKGIREVIVQAKDADFLFDDLLGETVTDQNGSFSIEIDDHAIQQKAGDQPDVYLVIKAMTGEILKTTRDDIRMDAKGNVRVDVGIAHTLLIKSKAETIEAPPGINDIEKGEQKKLTTWTWRLDCDLSDLKVAELVDELAEKSSALELMVTYMEQLNKDSNPQNPYFSKLFKLFELGKTPEKMGGHFYGVPIGIKSGALGEPLKNFCNFLGFLWGRTLANQCPWGGKSFSFMENIDKMNREIKGFDPSGSFSLGINHFTKLNLKALNKASFAFLTWWLGLDKSSSTARRHFGHEREGGFFVSHAAQSVFVETDREVYRLNYRFKELENQPPLRWLIDEMVEIADGLYLGQLLFATRRLQYDYDPNIGEETYSYEHFGYFILFDETWNQEARRLLPNLEIPVTAPGVFARKNDIRIESPKFRTFTFEKPPPPEADDEILAQVKQDLESSDSIMHLLKFYSDNLQGNFDNDSPYFLKLREIFHHGAAFETIEGFFRGALVTWRSEAFFRVFNFNILNAAWMNVGKPFSPWTGKSFEKISSGKLTHFTYGYEKGEFPTYWGANTQSLRTPAEIFTGKLMNAANVWIEHASADEARKFGYDLKCFFFIAKSGRAIDGGNTGKKVFQLNYRWPKLKTIPPDCYCIDELVKIAEGLYMGRLMYATELFKIYEPQVDPEKYRYRNFGYFLLMDDEWTRIRLDIGFDLENF